MDDRVQDDNTDTTTDVDQRGDFDDYYPDTYDDNSITTADCPSDGNSIWLPESDESDEYADIMHDLYFDYMEVRHLVPSDIYYNILEFIAPVTRRRTTGWLAHIYDVSASAPVDFSLVRWIARSSLRRAVRQSTMYDDDYDFVLGGPQFIRSLCLLFDVFCIEEVSPLGEVLSMKLMCRNKDCYVADEFGGIDIHLRYPKFRYVQPIPGCAYGFIDFIEDVDPGLVGIDAEETLMFPDFPHNWIVL
jgi:hypothetical protein